MCGYFEYLIMRFFHHIQIYMVKSIVKKKYNMHSGLFIR